MALLLARASHIGTAPTVASTVARASGIDMAVDSPRAARWKPGATAPAHLTGVLAGDNGFDPLLLTALANKPVQDLITGGFPNMAQREIIMANQTPEQALKSLQWMREAEIKHARLATLAAVGWPMAELFQGSWGLSVSGGRAPSIFNGGMGEGVIPFFLVLSLMGAATLENVAEERGNQQRQLGVTSMVAGDFGFDPMGWSKEEGAYRRKELQSNELFNGRLAMLAITGFAVQEFLWSKPVIEQTPFFFGR